MTFTEGEVRRLQGATVFDGSDQRVGTIGQVWAGAGGQPAWVSVHTGMFGMNEARMPLIGAEFTGGRLRTPFSRSLIHDAPDVGAGAGQPLDDISKRRLYAHYSLPYDDRPDD